MTDQVQTVILNTATVHANAFLMDLPVPSFVFHSSLLTMKSVDFVVGTLDGFHS